MSGMSDPSRNDRAAENFTTTSSQTYMLQGYGVFGHVGRRVVPHSVAGDGVGITAHAQLERNAHGQSVAAMR